MSETKIEELALVKEEILESYPKKTLKNRKNHLLVKDSSKGKQKIDADTRTIPGVMTTRGCAYAGCKGVVLGPIKDIVNIVHGPVGCSYYAWLTRRNLAKPGKDGKQFTQYCVTTDMKETDIVFGGEKKLMQAIREVKEIFDPPAIAISATCPVGLIGDDIASVAKQAEEELGITVLSASCEGYKGVSQSAGHHIACNSLMKSIIGTEELEEPGPYDINIFGEYNIGGDLWGVQPLLEKIGYRIVSTYTGDASIHDMAKAHQAKLSVVMCHRSINYANEMMFEKYKLPWLKINTVGIEALKKSLMNIANFFGDAELIKKTEEIIEEEAKRIEPKFEYYKKRLTGKKVMLFVGGSRSHHFQNLCKSLGMEVILAGYEFAHRDDYEGREVLKEVTSGKSKLSKKVVEDLTFKLEDGWDPAFSDEVLDKKKEELSDVFMEYKGMMHNMDDGAYLVDDMNHFETEILVKKLKPDVFCSGIKDKYVVQKMGVPSRQMHSYDYSGPYTGFDGAVLFAHDIDMAVSSPTWGLITPPWETKETDAT